MTKSRGAKCRKEPTSPKVLSTALPSERQPLLYSHLPIHHKDKELAGHITKAKGESIELDDFAVDFLLPIQLKVLQAVEECEVIARENVELKDNLCSAETNAEQTDNQLSKALADNEKQLAEIDRLYSPS